MQFKILNLAALPLKIAVSLDVRTQQDFSCQRQTQAVTLSTGMSVNCVILLHLRWRWRLGRENFIESCVIWLMSQPLGFRFVLWFYCFCVCCATCAVFMTKWNKVMLRAIRTVWSAIVIILSSFRLSVRLSFSLSLSDAVHCGSQRFGVHG